MSSSIIRGLSLTRPWPFAFVRQPVARGVAPKLIENRSWKPHAYIVGHYLALHAAQSWDEDDREFIAETMGMEVPNDADSPHSQIFGVCRVVGHVEDEDDEKLTDEQRPWFFGPYGWLLSDFVELPEPVPCKGGQGLWDLGKRPGVLEAVRLQYRAATATLPRSVSLPHGDVDDSDRVPTCPDCGDIADYEECEHCDGHGVDGLFQRCPPCDGQGGRYYCRAGCEMSDD